MRLGTRLECVRSLPRVLGACQNGGKEFAGRRLRLARRLSGVVEKLVRSWEVATTPFIGLVGQGFPLLRSAIEPT
ncbi:hypothetical protein BHM03_00060674 [Ensete ventricosum]|nr:hypothetical protein BHM03_00060674 [Ensete ventricosum]